MPSSTSSSSSDKISIRSILIISVGTFLIISVLHLAYLSTAGKARYKAESQEVENRVRMEDFLYENHSAKIGVIVGTSLSANVHHPDLVNLSFRGGSALTALEILCIAEQLPETILIEANLLYQPVDREMVEKFESDQRVTFPMLQDRYRPMSLLLGAIKGKSENRDPSVNLQSSRKLNATTKAKKLPVHLASAAVRLSSEELTTALALVQENVEKLEGLGSRVIFYLTPIDAEVVGQPRHQQWRKSFVEAFPNRPVEHLAISDESTSDGIHLCLEGNLEMGEQLGLLAGIPIEKNRGK